MRRGWQVIEAEDGEEARTLLLGTDAPCQHVDAILKATQARQAAIRDGMAASSTFVSNLRLLLVAVTLYRLLLYAVTLRELLPPG